MVRKKDLIGKRVRVKAVSRSALIIEDENNKQYVIFSYCGCNSGFWYIDSEEINDSNYNQFSSEIEELYQASKKVIGFTPDGYYILDEWCPCQCHTNTSNNLPCGSCWCYFGRIVTKP